MKNLESQIIGGCTIIGIALGTIDLYFGEKILTNGGNFLSAIVCGTFCGLFCINRIKNFQQNSQDTLNKDSE
jgi:uncharacterized membrane protein YiaA